MANWWEEGVGALKELIGLPETAVRCCTSAQIIDEPPSGRFLSPFLPHSLHQRVPITHLVRYFQSLAFGFQRAVVGKREREGEGESFAMPPPNLPFLVLKSWSEASLPSPFLSLSLPIPATVV